MFRESTEVSVIGDFVITEISEVIKVDSLEKGSEEVTSAMQDSGVTTIVQIVPNVKEGQFVRFDGSYKVLASEELFSTIKVGDHEVTVANHKLQEVA